MDSIPTMHPPQVSPNVAGSEKTACEIAHGRILAQTHPERVWRWETAAGRLRAQRRAKLIAQCAGLKPGIRAVEIGCGTGLFTEMFLQTGARLVAIDISDDLLKKARERNLPAAQVQFLTARFEEAAIGESFDAVIGSSVLHHLDCAVALEKIYALLKPGGRMCFAEPNMLNPQILLMKNIPWIKKRLGESPTETAFFRWILHKQLRRAGFENIVITPFDWLHPRTPAKIIPLVQRLSQMLEKIPAIREFSGSLLIRANHPANRKNG